MQQIQAQTEAIRSYTRCLEATNDANMCGPPPQYQTPLYQPQPPQYQPQQYQAPVYCNQVCSGNNNQYCQIECTR